MKTEADQAVNECCACSERRDVMLKTRKEDEEEEDRVSTELSTVELTVMSPNMLPQQVTLAVELLESIPARTGMHKDVCLSVSLCFTLSTCLFLDLFVCGCLSLSVCLSLCLKVSLSLSLSLTLSLSLSLFFFSVSLSLSLSLSPHPYACLCLSSSHFFSPLLPPLHLSVSISHHLFVYKCLSLSLSLSLSLHLPVCMFVSVCLRLTFSFSSLPPPFCLPYLVKLSDLFWCSAFLGLTILIVLFCIQTGAGVIRNGWFLISYSTKLKRFTVESRIVIATNLCFIVLCLVQEIPGIQFGIGPAAPLKTEFISEGYVWCQCLASTFVWPLFLTLPHLV